VVTSSAIPAGNIELMKARELGIPIVKRATFLAELTQPYQTIAVAGTHGKTTTTGMIAWLLEQDAQDPSFIVGGMLPDLGTNARNGSGKSFVIEADEYDHTFLGLEPDVAVVTNVELDHPDCYPTQEEFTQAFLQFAQKVRSMLIVCLDDPGAASLNPPGIDRQTYGISPGADWRADDIRANSAGGSDFLVLHEAETLGLVRTRLPGDHNVLNALAALAVSDLMGVEFRVAREALTNFHGAGRRFEVVGEISGITVIDDYAHHPTEIRATLQAARQRFPDSRIRVVFQPHTYSRLRALREDFARAFGDADEVIVTPVFAAREEPDPEFSGEKIAAFIKAEQVQFISDFDTIVQKLVQEARPGDVVLTLSAGDGNLVGTRLLEAVKLNEGESDHG
jgi:UDP-N-acetylmuramate--alanine ligase